jgi:hypothetical protein
MANPTGLRRPQSQIGVTPTNAQKLAYIAKGLGLHGITGMQGTTFTIFDTVLLQTSTQRQVLNFFANTSNKSRNFSNLQAGVLNAGEALLCEEVAFIALELTNSDLTSDANAILNAYQIQASPNGSIPNQGALTTGMLNLTIANSKVQKDVSTYEQDPSFNPRTTGITVADTSVITNVRLGESKVYLEAPPVLPPNQKISLTWEIGPTGAVLANVAIMCVIGRFGSIFAAKQTL